MKHTSTTMPTTRSRWHGAGLALGLATLVTTACEGSPTADAAPAHAPAVAPTPVEPLAAPVRPAGERGFVGVVVAREQVDLGAKHEGELREVLVRLGDEVEAGQVVATLDDGALQEALEIARAERWGAKAELASAAVELQESRDRWQGDERAAEVLPARELASTRFAAKRAESGHSRAQARVARERARIEQLEHQLAQTRVVAPFAGTVTVRYLDPGALVQQGVPIVRLIAAGDPWIRFATPAVGAPGLAVGDVVEVELEADSTRLRGVVQQVAAEIEPTSQMLLVEARLDLPVEQRDRIHPGAAVWVRARAHEGPRS